MKIYNNNIVQKSVAANFKGDVINLPPRNGQAAKTTEQKSVVNPNYYQSINGIKKPSYVMTIPLDSGENTTLELDYDTITNYLSDKNGNPDVKLIKQFALMYKDSFKTLTDRNNAQIELNKSFLDNPFSHSELFNGTGIPYSGYKELSEDLLLIAQKEVKRIPKKAFNRTKKLFDLSRTSDGYDFSDMDKKNKIIDLTEDIASGYQLKPADILSALIRKTTKDNGGCDINLAHNSLKVIDSQSFWTRNIIDYSVETVKKYCSKDPKQENRIISTIIKLNKTNYPMDIDNENFETLLSLCFDKDNKFQQERADLVFKSIEAADKSMKKVIKSDEDADNYMERYYTMAASAIADYFALITDDNGDIHPEKNQSVDKYISETFQNLSFI